MAFRGQARRFFAAGRENSQILLFLGGVTSSVIYTSSMATSWLQDLSARQDKLESDTVAAVQGNRSDMHERLLDYGFAYEFANLRKSCSPDSRLA